MYFVSGRVMDTRSSQILLVIMGKRMGSRRSRRALDIEDQPATIPIINTRQLSYLDGSCGKIDDREADGNDRSADSRQVQNLLSK